MDKNSITGFVLIGAILIGYTWYSSKEAAKQQAYQAQLESIAMVEHLAQMKADSIAYAELHANDTLDLAAQSMPVQAVY